MVILILVLTLILEEQIYKEKNANILVYDISCKFSVNAKPLYIRFNKMDGFIKSHNGII